MTEQAVVRTQVSTEQTRKEQNELTEDERVLLCQIAMGCVRWAWDAESNTYELEISGVRVPYERLQALPTRMNGARVFRTNLDNVLVLTDYGRSLL